MMRARVFVFVVATLAGALPAGAQTPSTQPGATTEVSERFSRSSHLDANGAFDLINLHGNIVITAGSGRDVTIEAVKRVQRPNPNAARALLQTIDIQVVEEANRIEVRTSYPRPRNFPGSVDFTITVPADATVSVRATGGGIRATGIRVEALRTVAGDIDLVDASADQFATASAVSGNVTVRGLKASAIQLTTVSGNVRVDNSRADRLMARAVSGDVEYAGELSRSGRYELVSHSGDVRLLLSGATGFDVQANSFSGTVQSDFPITRRGRGGEGNGRGAATPRAIRGAFGDASAMLVLRAFSGNVSITRR
ncbi:MAG TPA: DUF4097 family beta strand repeat-containing protein [Vicinamibacterales bacterium]|nr:DUF4097 family beta strand repeat-containing protein [Vicinamibacterales bacterium]